MSEQMPQSDEQIYRSYLSRESTALGACPDSIELSAYLDNRCSPQEQQSIESHIAECPACLAAISEICMLFESVVEAAPQQVIDSAKMLVEQIPIEARKLSRLRLALHPLAAAAVLGICALGYMTGISFKAEALSSDQLAHEMSFGVFESLEDDEQELELLAILVKENSQ